jgi:S1-C subfamily serine protease
MGGLENINTAIASATGYYAGCGYAIPSNIVGKVDDFVRSLEGAKGGIILPPEFEAAMPASLRI